MTYYEGQKLHDEKCEHCEHHGASGDGGKMSNENQETIAGIVKEMRDLGWLDEKSTDNIPRSLQALGLRTYADRIEAAAKRFYDKYKEHTDELNRQILVLKREKEMSDTYFCGYDPEEALVAQCSTCRFFKKKFSHCTLNDSLANARYKCSGWKFKTNKECADEYNASRNHEVDELRAENARLRAALKPVLKCKVMSAMTAEIGPGKSEYCAALIEKAQRIYNGCNESEVAT